MATQHHQNCERQYQNTLQPIMSLMVILIPVLLLSSEFASVSIVEMSCNANGTSHVMPGSHDAVVDSSLYLLVSDSTLIFSTRNSILFSISYKSATPSARYSERSYSTPTDDNFDAHIESRLRKCTFHHMISEVILAPEQNTPYETIVKLMDLSRMAGFGEVSITRLKS